MLPAFNNRWDSAVRVLAVLVLACLTWDWVGDAVTGVALRERELRHIEHHARLVDAVGEELARQAAELGTMRAQMQAHREQEHDADPAPPFGDDVLRQWLRFPETEQEHRFLKYPQVAPAPVGRAALDLARTLRYPARWGARMRPRHFILGPPKTGTTFLANCLRLAMVGNASNRPYPLSQMRWPIYIGKPEGEPIVKLSTPLINNRVWNRTGYRRWDAPKELWTYPDMGRYPQLPQGWLQRRRFPPVEPESAFWALMDATPDQLMIPEAADAAAADLRGAPFAQSFLVMLRSPLDRAYSHFLLYTELRRLWGWSPEPLTVFAEKLHLQHRMLRARPVCERLLDDPAGVLADEDLTRRVLVECMYEDPDAEMLAKAGLPPNASHSEYRLARIPMYLPFGFAALGARYWMDRFPQAYFRFAHTATLKQLDEAGTMRFLQRTFDVDPMKPRCASASDWQSTTCTGARRYDHAYLFCGKNSPALTSQAWSKREGLLYEKGSAEALQEYTALSERWHGLFVTFLKTRGITTYDPQTGYD